MRQNLVKCIVLGMLIVLCIWQTAVLWLGNLSSPNFLSQNSNMHSAMIEPQNIWMNMGMGKLTYNISEGTSKYKGTRLIDELVEVLKNKKVKVEKIEDIKYEELLGKQGIIYEYGTLLTIDEIIGLELGVTPEEEVKIDNILVDLSDYDNHKTYVYLIDSILGPLYKLTVYERLDQHQYIIEKFNSEDKSVNFIEYQASRTQTSNQSERIVGNVFLPLNSSENPIIYDRLTITNPIKGSSDLETKENLSPYINGFFENPLFKEEVAAENGDIIYRENMNMSVRYSPQGTLEFNKASAYEADKLSSLEKLNMITSFIEESSSVPEYLSRNIYLSDISYDITKSEYTYRFEYRHNDFPVILSESIKNQLGIEAPLELVIKNNEIIRGKWILLKIDADSEGGQYKGELMKDFGTVIDEMYEREDIGMPEDSVIQDIQCGYLFRSLSAEIHLGWNVVYNDENYFM